MARASQVAKESVRYKTEVGALGQRIKALRQARKWTLEQAAGASDIDLKHWQKLESGVINVTLVTLVRVAAGLDVPIASLFKPPAKR